MNAVIIKLSVRPSLASIVCRERSDYFVKRGREQAREEREKREREGVRVNSGGTTAELPLLPSLQDCMLLCIPQGESTLSRGRIKGHPPP